MTPSPAPLFLAVTGASGLVGRQLLPALRRDGHRVVPLVRGVARAGESRWDPTGPWDAAGLDGLDGVIHLAGEGIADGRWTAGRKERIRQSRIEGTRSLVATLARLSHPPKVYVGASAMGIYGDRGDEVLSETAGVGTDFLAGVAAQWESEGTGIGAAGARVVHLRFGLLLSADGGVLGRMLLPFRLGLGGRLGSGRQWMSWIALDDVVRVIQTALQDPRYQGAINVTTPNPCTNREFTATLGRVLRRPALIPVPTFALTLLFGEAAPAAILASQRLVPARLQELGFEWQYPDLPGALRHLLGR
jgi:uncharacterized protein